MATSTINRVAIYARVSTTNHGQDVSMQTDEMEQFSTARDWNVVDSYLDIGISGAKDKRPELDRLMQDARRRRFDGVLCWKLDRIGRSLKHLVNLLAELEAVGVALVSLSDNLDLSTPQGRLMFQIIGAMAEFERSLIQERVRAGLRNARAKGKRLGRPRVVVDSRRIATLRKSGASWATVCRETGLSKGTAQRAIHNLPKNTGELCGQIVSSAGD